MSSDRPIRLWSLVVERACGQPAALEHVAAAVIIAAGVDAVAVAVTLTPARETVYVSDDVAAAMQDLTLTLGEGPSVDAATGGPSLGADLEEAGCLARWPIFAPAAAEAGILAAFALPLRVGAIRLGVMDLYRAAPGVLDDSALADALFLADLACALLLDSARPDVDGRVPEQAASHHPEVHQATGMITVQLGVTAAVALIRLRAYAYSAGRGLREVAGDVVSRKLRFAPERDDPLDEPGAAPDPLRRG
ncbi:MAG: hypothetical protein QOE17_381 [Gaiellales bacterium]|nr:hypothetical protein [Gaiellales bacterium]